MTVTPRSRFLIAAVTVVVASLALLSLGMAAAGQGYVSDGILLVVWGDPRPGQAGGDVRFELAQPDGTTVSLQMAPALRNIAIGAFGKRVRIEGGVSIDVATGEPTIDVEGFELAEEGPVSTPAAGPTTRRVLSILLKYKGDTQAPHTPAFFHALVNPTAGNAGLGIPGTINGFYSKTSWNRLRWAGDVVGVGGLSPTGWLTLPRTKLQYAPCGWSSSCAGPNLFRLFDDAVALAKAQGVDLSVYSNINLMLNNDLDCCAWGGGAAVGGRYYGVTWNPPWSQEAGTLAHELGHSIGLPHSGWVYHAYDSTWDLMSGRTSASWLQCGSYWSVNSGRQTTVYCSEPGNGFIPIHKDRLGWIPTGNKVIINSKTTRTITIESNAAPLGTRPKLVQICLAGYPCEGSTARFLTVEARLKSHQYEKGLPNEGVVIHDFKANRAPISGPCFFNSQSGWAVPIDATPGDWRGSPRCDSGGRTYPNYALHNAQFGVGKSYVNPTFGVRVDVLSRTADSYTVRVTRTK